MRIPIPILLLMLFFSCDKKASETTAESNAKSEKINIETMKPSREEQIKLLNDEIIQSLKSKNYRKFAQYIHPEKGVRFSMYAYLNDKNKIFSKSDFEKYVNTDVKFTWGTRDGSGEPLVLSIKNYIETWVLKKDFASSQYTYRVFQKTGNSLNNLEEVYPGKDFTENYLPGTEKYSGMDWNVLRFVFEEFNGKPYLIAVVNDEWTI